MRDLTLVALDLMIGDAPDADDAAGIELCHVIVDWLANRFGEDVVLGLLIELGDLERQCRDRPDDEDDPD